VTGTTGIVGWSSSLLQAVKVMAKSIDAIRNNFVFIGLCF